MKKNNYYKIALFLFSFFLFCCNNEKEKKLKNQFKTFISTYYIYYPLIENNIDIRKFDIYLKRNYSYLNEIKNNQYILSMEDKNLLIIKDTILNLKVKVNLKSIKKQTNCVGDKLTKGYFSKDFIKIGGFAFQKKLHDFFQNLNYNLMVPFYNTKGPLGSDKVMLFQFLNGEIYLDCVTNISDEALIKKTKKDLTKFFEENSENLNFDFALIPIGIQNY